MSVLDATLSTAGGRVAALRAGSNGPVVLLVPGYTGSKEDFAPILGPIADAGLQAWAIDLPGQYESPGPDDPDAYTPDALAGRIHELLDALGGRAHLLGHSYGGLVARAAVIANPGMFGSLVLMGSGPAAIDGARRERMRSLAPVLPVSGVAGVWTAMQAADAAQPGYVTPAPMRAAFLRRRFMAGSPAMLAGMAAALLAEPDRVAELASAEAPVLVLHGACDDAWPPALQRAMAGRLGADYAVIDSAAHAPAMENPAATVARLLAFWRRHS